MDAQRVLVNWDLGEVTSTDIFSTDRYRCSGNVCFIQAGDARFVLKRIKRRNTLDPLFTLLPELHKRGVPVAVPVPTRRGELAIFRDGDCYYMAPFLYGSVISDHFGTGMERRSQSFGVALAKLHNALKEITLTSSPADMNLLGQVQACEAKVRACGISHPIVDILEQTAEAFRLSKPLPSQLIHRDSHASNVVFLNDEVSGWLDFELATTGPRLFDLCYYSTSLLMDALCEPDQTAKWYSVLKNLVCGYQEVNVLNENERTLLPYVLLAIEAIFISYYLGIDDTISAMRNIYALEWIHNNLELTRVCR